MATAAAPNTAATGIIIFETLALTGIAMQYVKLSRPASGTEHIISHYWECKKLERGVYSDYHGKKVGVATLIVADVYHKVAAMKGIKAHADRPDWQDIYRASDEVLAVCGIVESVVVENGKLTRGEYFDTLLKKLQ